MLHVLADPAQWAGSIPIEWLYAAVFGVAVLENLFPPIPGDLMVAYAGYMAGTGVLDPVLVALSATLGAAVGFMIMFEAGRRIGPALLAPDRFRFLPKDKLLKARNWVVRWGYLAVAVNRFLTVARSGVSLAVGMAQMGWGRTALLCTLGGAVWMLLLTQLGYHLGAHWHRVGSYLAVYGWVVAGVVLVVALVRVGLRIHRARRG